MVSIAPVLGNTLVQVALALPLFLAWLVAAALAIARWERHPRASLYALIAVGLYALQRVIGIVVGVGIPFWVESRRFGGPVGVRIGAIISGVNVLQGLMAAVAWVFIILAIFSGRGREA